MDDMASLSPVSGRSDAQGSRSLFRVTVNLNCKSTTMKAIVHLVKTLQRCLAPRPVRNRRFIEWELPYYQD